MSDSIQRIILSSGAKIGELTMPPKNKYEIRIRKIKDGKPKERRDVTIKTDVGIDWLARAIRKLGDD